MPAVSFADPSPSSLASREGVSDVAWEEQLLISGAEAAPPKRLLAGLSRKAVGALLGVGLLAAGAVTAARLGRPASAVSGPAHAVPAQASSLAEVKCGGLYDDCTHSKCCVDHGAAGLQCWAKNEKFAMCIDTCKKGVHKQDKDKGTWSCEKLGKRSAPDPAQCAGPNENCLQKGCCKPGGKKGFQCFKKDNTWGSCTESCKPGVHKGEPGGHYDASGKLVKPKWSCTKVGPLSKPDPCSAPWEDCTNTKCCSTTRGGLGMTCIQKDDTYATCMYKLDKKKHKGWSGKPLGNRTRFEAGCSWAGKECGQTGLCCNDGFNCVKKDDSFVGCVQAMTVSTWAKMPVKLPAGWEGTKMGGWRSEYAVQPAPKGSPMAGTSFFCFMAVLPKSPEMELLKVAKDNHASIFGCNASKVFHSWRTGASHWDSGTTTLVNTAVFLKVMDWVKEDGQYLNYDWTIKVDADCVFLPERLRAHVWGLRPPPETAIYLKNNKMAGMGNSGFLGAIEVFSKRAMQIYFDNSDGCAHTMGTNAGEDGFFKGCMDALGVGFMWDKEMFEPNYDPSKCTIGSHAAYHPLKFASHWKRCWDIASGKMCQGLTYDCGGALDPPVGPR